MKDSSPRPPALGFIFVTLVLLVLGFGIIIPVLPGLVTQFEGGSVAQGSNAYGSLIGVFALMQFIASPILGALSDRFGRRKVLLLALAGSTVDNLVMGLAPSLGWLYVGRVIAGLTAGVIATASAYIADVTPPEKRAQSFGLVGAAFGLGLVTGPVLGAVCAQFNLLAALPSLERFGINPYSVPALVSLGFCLANLAWVHRSFRETLPESARSGALETRLRNPIRAILNLDNADVRRANVVAFVYAVAFVAMEATLTYLAADRFGYTVGQNGIMLGFLGVCSIVTQGFIVRILLKKADEIPVLAGGLISTSVGLLVVGLSVRPWMMYAGIVLLATGSGLVNPSTTGLISLYSSQDEQGRVLGIFRSLGSLARAFTPMLAGAIYFMFDSKSVFVGAAVLVVAALALSARLAKPVR